METEFTKEYFINKFEAIPNELWTIRVFTDKNNNDCHCALGHCGFTSEISTKEGFALCELLKPIGPVEDINDNPISYYGNFCPDYSDLGSTPKERILKALRQIPD